MTRIYKMKKKNLASALLLAFHLMGCASTETDAPKNVLIEKAICCQDYSQISWIPLTGEHIDLKIDNQSQVIAIENEKSYIAAFSLPDNIDQIQVQLSSWMRAKGVFAPKVMLLDAQFKPVSSLELTDFKVTPSDLFRLTSYQSTFVLDREKTPYMLVYSPLSYRKDKITIPHPERLRAEELGMARPMVVDPVIEHAKWGELELKLRPLRLRAYRADEMPASALKAATANLDLSKAIESLNMQTEPKVTQMSNTIMAETEDFYNQQIHQAIEKVDISKAIQWLEEAKRAGSTTAESTFIKAIKEK